MQITRYPVLFVGAGPGDPELVTVKGRKALDRADVVVYAGSLVNPELLYGLDAEIHDSAGLDLDRIMDIMVSAWRNGRRVVRLHTGDPSIYGAIGEQMKRLDDAGIDYEIIPGVTSATASAAAIRAELTLPEVTQTVIFTRAGGRTPVPDRESIGKLASHQATMCIFLSVSMIDDVVRELLSGGYAADTPVAVVEKATWPEERIVKGTVGSIAVQVKEAGIKKTAMILVGNTVNNFIEKESRLYASGFTHGYRSG